mgnify:FL=1
MFKQYWLMKSEPDSFSFQDLKSRPKQREPWDGVRNYQARNFMRDGMSVGDGVLFYHSNTKPPGIVGLAEVVSEAYPDPTAFDQQSKYYDEKSDPNNPRWFLVDVAYVNDFKHQVSLEQMKAMPELADMKVLQKGNRLSITPVSENEYRVICAAGL